MESNIFDILDQAAHEATQSIFSRGLKPHPFKFATEGRVKRRPHSWDAPSDNALLAAQKLRKTKPHPFRRFAQLNSDFEIPERILSAEPVKKKPMLFHPS